MVREHLHQLAGFEVVCHIPDRFHRDPGTMQRQAVCSLAGIDMKTGVDLYAALRFPGAKGPLGDRVIARDNAAVRA